MNRKHKRTDWIRFALKCGLLVTDASVWASVRHFLNEKSDDVQQAFHRTDNIATGVRESRRWSHFSTLLTGVGIGVGVGMLIAPTSGQRVRGAIRDTAIDAKNKVTNVAAWAGRIRSQESGGGAYAH